MGGNNRMFSRRQSSILPVVAAVVGGRLSVQAHETDGSKVWCGVPVQPTAKNGVGDTGKVG